MEAQDFIDIFLPDFVSQAFDVVNTHSDTFIVHIPGMDKIEYIEDNIKSLDFELTATLLV